ncbi:hypothetical protein BDC45DRAFT_577150 [Circinella umbellata]|nr:hypothetical protein BDC45DRAFT_577150 [Circinella umbellata]
MSQELNPIDISEQDIMDIDERSDMSERIEVVEHNPSARPAPTPSHLRPLRESELAPQENIDRYLETPPQRQPQATKTFLRRQPRATKAFLHRRGPVFSDLPPRDPSRPALLATRDLSTIQIYKPIRFSYGLDRIRIVSQRIRIGFGSVMDQSFNNAVSS